MGRLSFKLIALSICFAGISISCEYRQDKLQGFKDEPQYSIVFDLNKYAFPTSDIELDNVVKANDRYYCLFDENDIKNPEYCSPCLMCYSLSKRKQYQIPLPESNRKPTDIFQRNDTLFLQIGYHGFDQKKYFFLDQKNDSWKRFTASPSFIDRIYDDKNWAVKYVEHGEFGDAMWFFDKASSREYAFVGLSGRVHRIDTTFYIVGRTRVYELTDPSIGFLCDSTTVYANVRDERLLARRFFDAGYYSQAKIISPVLRYDNDDKPMYYGIYEDAEADTLIIGSFRADGKLHCLLDTPSSTVLAKWDGQQMTVLHRFPKYSENSISSKYIWRITNTICHTYMDSRIPDDELLLVLGKRGKGQYDLYEIGKAGNSLLAISYKHGLEPVEKDGFETLFSYILRHRKGLYYSDIVKVEHSLGAKESSINMNPSTYTYPSQEAFAPNKTYHIDILTKQIKEEFTMRSEYWVSDSDLFIPAALFEWESTRDACQPSFDRQSKYAELEAIITRLCGSGTIVTPAKHWYTEWTSDSLTIRLYNTYNLRLFLFRSDCTSGN